MGTVIVSIVVQLAMCWCCYKLGQTIAWNKISKEYIAIHKSAIIGPILIKNNGGYKHYEKTEKSNRAYKKAFTKKKKHH